MAALLAACAGPATVGTLDTGAGRARLLHDPKTGVFSVATDDREPAVLDGISDARLLGAWGAGRFITAVVAGSAGRCRTVYSFVDITPGATSSAVRLPDCGSAAFRFDGTSLVATEAGIRPKIWRFSSGLLYGPFFGPAARARVALRRRSAGPAGGAPDQDILSKDTVAPPPVSGEAGDEVIPKSVGTPPAAAPAVVNLQ